MDHARQRRVCVTAAGRGCRPAGEDAMNDDEILARIQELVGQEQALRQQEADGRTTDPGQRRMHALTVEMDELWDLVRQRRALRDAGQDPDAAGQRDAPTVEHYMQ